jgi:hypothetical protein
VVGFKKYKRTLKIFEKLITLGVSGLNSIWTRRWKLKVDSINILMPGGNPKKLNPA